jgi:hypothetical protein
MEMIADRICFNLYTVPIIIDEHATVNPLTSYRFRPVFNELTGNGLDIQKR